MLMDILARAGWAVVVRQQPRPFPVDHCPGGTWDRERRRGIILKCLSGNTVRKYLTSGHLAPPLSDVPFGTLGVSHVRRGEAHWRIRDAEVLRREVQAACHVIAGL